ncbi:MFS transporter [Penicillium herquei]|nr:MFS transporter [Penicillium herquei]
MVISTAVTFAQNLGPLSLAPMFGEMIVAFDSNLADVIQFTGVCILVLGFSNFIWVPMSSTFGRRPVLILSTLICLGSNIWRAKAKTYGSFMGACVLNGIGAGPAETIQPTVITDIMFLHERGAYNSLYFTFLFGALMVGPAIAGVMATKSSWRNFWWLNVALQAAALVAIIFLFPETKWHRANPKDMQNQEQQKSVKFRPSHDEKITSDDHVESIEQDRAEVPVAAQATSEPDSCLGKGHPSKSQFKLFQPSDNFLKTIVQEFMTPWKLFAFPIVEFSAFVVSWSSSSFLTGNLTQSQAFGAPPYNFSDMKIGLFNLATFVGALIGLFTSGWLSDWFSMRLTRRNGGIREPEMRLPTMIPFVIIMLIGNFVVAYGYQRQWSWPIIVIIGYACEGIQVAALPAIASTYSVDSYRPVAGSVFVAITVNKNLWGYGFSKFITNWSQKSGYIDPIMMNMCLNLLFCLFAIPLYFWGKTCRKWTRNSTVHYM